MKFFICLTLATVFLWSGSVYAERTEAEARAELEAVQKQISKLQKQRKRDGEKLSRAGQSLKDSEIAEQKSREALRDVRSKLQAARKKQTALLNDQKTQQAVMTNMQADLALQMRMAYMQGQEQWLKLVLSQEDPGAMGRRLTWHEYMTKQRSELIAGVQQQLQELQLIAVELQAEAERLEELESDQKVVLEDVKDARSERQAAVAKLEKGLSSSESQLASLKNQAKVLDKLVVELANVLPEMPSLPSGPFAQQKGKLAWPVKGKIRRTYGQRRANSQLRWNGVLIGAPAGNNVRAFSHGRVVFADWLQGMGLLIIVEHGDGYLSLYGHNQELLHGVGSWVQPGEIIGHVGDSGGQSETGVYFELRKNGEPINPGTWVKK